MTWNRQISAPAQHQNDTAAQEEKEEKESEHTKKTERSRFLANRNFFQQTANSTESESWTNSFYLEPKTTTH
jgi:hypothetical protein